MTHKGYGEKSYWDSRYLHSADPIYEWYLGWNTLATYLTEYLPAPTFTPTKLIEEAHQPNKQTSLHQLKSSPTSNNSLSTPPASSSTDVASASSSSASASASSSSSSQSAHSLSRDIPLVPPHLLPSQHFTLIVGCGNSELSYHMYQAGFTNIRSTDYSEVVIKQMKKIYSAIPSFAESFELQDARKMSFPSDYFELIIDKGTLDAILCGMDSSKNALLTLDECHRVLKPGGLFFLITYGQPSARLPFLEKPRFKWTVKQRALDKSKWMYIMTKLPPVD